MCAMHVWSRRNFMVVLSLSHVSPASQMCKNVELWNVCVVLIGMWAGELSLVFLIPVEIFCSYVCFFVCDFLFYFVDLLSFVYRSWNLRWGPDQLNKVGFCLAQCWGYSTALVFCQALKSQDWAATPGTLIQVCFCRSLNGWVLD